MSSQHLAGLGLTVQHTGAICAHDVTADGFFMLHAAVVLPICPKSEPQLERLGGWGCLPDYPVRPAANGAISNSWLDSMILCHQ